jgi:CubicO group peptidase (beta-lactamase class C family)
VSHQKVRAAVFTLGVALLPLLGVAAARSAAQNSSSSATIWLDAAFTAISSDGPGCSAALYHDGEMTLQRGYGLADIEGRVPAGADTIYNVGSVAKQFTAFGVLLLADAGRIKLDADVHRYLPELPRYSGSMTVRNLMRHTSGVVDYYDVWDIAETAPESPGPGDALRLASKVSFLNFEPGSDFLYSNTGYQLLATIASRAAGKPFDRYMADAVFRPLGMNRTRVVSDSSKAGADVAVTYRTVNGVRSRRQTSSRLTGATAVYTTARDLARWSRNLERRSLGSAAVYQELRTPTRLTTGSTIDYGAGIVIETLDGRTVLSHGGESLGYIAHFAEIPSARVGAAVLCSTMAVQPSMIVDAMLQHEAAGAERPATSSPVVDVMPYAGMYEFADGSTVDLVPRDGLLLPDGVARLALHPVDGERYELGNIPVYFRFSQDAGGTRSIVRTLFGVGPVHGVAAARWAPSRAGLTRFEGRYENTELGQSFSVTLDGERLKAVSSRRGSQTFLRPRTERHFVAADADTYFVFEPDEMLVTSGTLRTRLLPFRRAAIAR